MSQLWVIVEYGLIDVTFAGDRGPRYTPGYPESAVVVAIDNAEFRGAEDPEAVALQHAPHSGFFTAIPLEDTKPREVRQVVVP